MAVGYQQRGSKKYEAGKVPHHESEELPAVGVESRLAQAAAATLARFQQARDRVAN